jgi:uncharacterized PurR-regulated membrane protein YhhQ (DUF165 family)
MTDLESAARYAALCADVPTTPRRTPKPAKPACAVAATIYARCGYSRDAIAYHLYHDHPRYPLARDWRGVGYSVDHGAILCAALSGNIIMIDAGLYILAILVANVTAAWFIGPVAVGTLFFGTVFTLRDRLHLRYGRGGVYWCVAAASIGTAAIALYGGASWRILAASLVALIIGESADTEIFQALHRRSWLVRVAASNSVSVPLDTIIFNMIAFYGDLPLSFLVALSLADMAIKALSSGIIALWRTSN